MDLDLVNFLMLLVLDVDEDAAHSPVSVPAPLLFLRGGGISGSTVAFLRAWFLRAFFEDGALEEPAGCNLEASTGSCPVELGRTLRLLLMLPSCYGLTPLSLVILGSVEGSFWFIVLVGCWWDVPLLEQELLS